MVEKANITSGNKIPKDYGIVKTTVLMMAGNGLKE